MKKSILCFVALCLMALLFNTGCKNKEPESTTDSLVQEVDSMQVSKDTTAVDSITELVEEEVMPTAADELFDDFFFNFAASRKVQKERINFPLTVTTYGKAQQVEKNAWKRETFFMKQGYYTLIFHNYKQQNLVKDTAVNKVIVERINVAQNSVTRWNFARARGLWHMQSKDIIYLKEHPDAAFLSFYEKFATDAEFAQEHLSETVTFTGPDPDDDFATMTGEIIPEQWAAFAPQLPSGTLYNIIYGDYGNSAKKSNIRLFLIRGIANGLQTDLVFNKKNGKWKLTKCTM